MTAVAELKLLALTRQLDSLVSQRNGLMSEYRHAMDDARSARAALASDTGRVRQLFDAYDYHQQPDGLLQLSPAEAVAAQVDMAAVRLAVETRDRARWLYSQTEVLTARIGPLQRTVESCRDHLHQTESHL